MAAESTSFHVPVELHVTGELKRTKIVQKIYILRKLSFVRTFFVVHPFTHVHTPYRSQFSVLSTWSLAIRMASLIPTASFTLALPGSSFTRLRWRARLWPQSGMRGSLFRASISHPMSSQLVSLLNEWDKKLPEWCNLFDSWCFLFNYRKSSITVATLIWTPPGIALSD